LPLNDEHVVVALAAVFPQTKTSEEGGAAKTPSCLHKCLVLGSSGPFYALHRYEPGRVRLRGQILDMSESQRGLMSSAFGLRLLESWCRIAAEFVEAIAWNGDMSSDVKRGRW
jgi:hypothetical protein